MKKLYIFTACSIAFIIASFLTGCETKSASSSVSITPDSTTIIIGQSITFTASGGYEYSWSLENNSWGTLSNLKGSSTVYTSRYNPGTNSTPATQIITVQSSIEGSSGGTNANTYSVTATAIISHLGSEE